MVNLRQSNFDRWCKLVIKAHFSIEHTERNPLLPIVLKGGRQLHYYASKRLSLGIAGQNNLKDVTHQPDALAYLFEFERLDLASQGIADPSRRDVVNRLRNHTHYLSVLTLYPTAG